MYAVHGTAGAWDLMLHGNVFLQYIDEGSDRGASQLGSINWFMGMARRPFGGGDLAFRGMLSLEPWTVGDCGYPELLATGEFCDRLGPLHDRQHPHDFFMELAALYEQGLGQDLAVQLYGGLAGEPALGPVAFPHRASALPNPFAPIGHHWQDASHIVFGVLTAGLFGRRWKAEASLFNGREPDAHRFDLDLGPLDSFSGRLWYLPHERWAFQLSAGHLREAEQHHPGEPRTDVNRYTASASYHLPVVPDGLLATTVVWGRNDHGDHGGTDSFLLEGALNLADRNLWFARGEIVDKTGQDLVLPHELEDGVFTVGRTTLGYTRQFGRLGPVVPGLGGSISMSFLPGELEPFYGTRTAFGWAIFASLRPAPMEVQVHMPDLLPAPPAPAATPAQPEPHHDDSQHRH